MVRAGCLMLMVALLGGGEQSREGREGSSPAGGGEKRRASWQVNVKGGTLDLARSGSNIVGLTTGDVRTYQAVSSGSIDFRMDLVRGSDGQIALGEQATRTVMLRFPDEYTCVSPSLTASVLHASPADVTFSGAVTCRPIRGGAEIPAEASGRFNQSGAP